MSVEICNHGNRRSVCRHCEVADLEKENSDLRQKLDAALAACAAKDEALSLALGWCHESGVVAIISDALSLDSGKEFVRRSEDETCVNQAEIYKVKTLRGAE